MEFVDQKVEYLGLAPSNEEDILRMIEKAGRTCYKSEDKITPESYRAFFRKIGDRNHGSVLEHSNICVKIDPSIGFNYLDIIGDLHKTKKSAFFEFVYWKDDHYLAGSVRAWFELIVSYGHRELYNPGSELLYIFKFLIQEYPFVFGILKEKMGIDSFLGGIDDLTHGVESCPMRIVTEQEQLAILKASDYTVNLPVFIFRVLCDRGITHEIVRNRSLQFSQESTRYVNYYKKIGLRFFSLFNKINRRDKRSSEEIRDLESYLSMFLKTCENTYNHLVDDSKNDKLMHQEFARGFLPNCLMAEIVISGRYGYDEIFGGFDLSSQLTHFIRQRGSAGAHPDIRPIANKMEALLNEVIKK